MRVLHVQKVAGISGSERHLLELLPALASNGISVRMCVLAGGEYERFTRPLRAAGVDVASVRAGPDANPLLFASLTRQIRRFRPDLVHTHLFHADFYGQPAARATRVPAVSSVHAAHNFYRREPYRTLARLTHGRAARTIAISHYVGRFVEELRLNDHASTRVVHYGIDASGWRQSAARRADARERLGIAPEEVAVGIASRLIPGKGHELLIDALAAALGEAPGLRLLIAGEGPRKTALAERVRHRAPSAVRFLGFLPDVRGFLGACDIVAFPTLPSFGEGFGLVALEAMAAERPVVASRVGPLPEIVVDGVTGLLVPHDDPGPLADALVRLAADPPLRERMGGAALVRAGAEFSLEAMVERTISVYREVA